MSDAWWHSKPTLLQECCEVVRRSRLLSKPPSAVATPASVVLLYTSQWSRKFPTIQVDLENDQHHPRIVCLLQTISLMSDRERKILSTRTSPVYTQQLYEFYLARERYSDVTFNTAICKERIWPVVYALVSGWDNHCKLVFKNGGVDRWRLRTILEPTQAGRDWMRWTRVALRQSTLVESLRMFTT